MSGLPARFCNGARIVLSGSVFEHQGIRLRPDHLRVLLLEAGALEVLVNPHPRNVSMIQHMLIANAIGATQPVIKAATAVSMPLLTWDAVMRFCRHFPDIRELARVHRLGAQPVSPVAQAPVPMPAAATPIRRAGFAVVECHTHDPFGPCF